MRETNRCNKIINYISNIFFGDSGLLLIEWYHSDFSYLDLAHQENIKLRDRSK